MSRGLTKAQRIREMERRYLTRAYSDIEMADRLGVDRTTVYRDRVFLESEVPFIQDENNRWKIDRLHYLSAMRINIFESLALYLAARRVSRQIYFANPHVASAIEKLAPTLGQPMTEKLVASADFILGEDSDPSRLRIIEVLTQSWVSKVKVKIAYRSLRSNSLRNYVISPYLIEPSTWSDGIYLIGYSDVHNDIGPFKLDRIEDIHLTTESFEIPEDFNEAALLQFAWGVWGGNQKPVIVILKFSAGSATRRIKESTWHPQEQVQDLPDGSCIWSAPVSEWREMLSWIRGWGADVEVIEPNELREAIIAEAFGVLNRYGAF